MDFLAGDFEFRNRFRDLSDEQVTQACQEIHARFSGILTLWRVCRADIREAKRRLCMNYLVAWLLTNKYPDQAIGVSGMGGIPLKSKHIADITLSYNLPLRESSLLSSLTTNSYGVAALEMIQTAPENYTWVT